MYDHHTFLVGNDGNIYSKDYEPLLLGKNIASVQCGPFSVFALSEDGKLYFGGLMNLYHPKKAARSDTSGKIVLVESLQNETIVSLRVSHIPNHHYHALCATKEGKLLALDGLHPPHKVAQAVPPVKILTYEDNDYAEDPCTGYLDGNNHLWVIPKKDAAPVDVTFMLPTGAVPHRMHIKFGLASVLLKRTPAQYLKSWEPPNKILVCKRCGNEFRKDDSSNNCVSKPHTGKIFYYEKTDGNPDYGPSTEGMWDCCRQGVNTPGCETTVHERLY